MDNDHLKPSEIAIFNRIKRYLKIIFDVGVRTCLDYPNLHPKADYHLFEPNPQFVEYLTSKVGNQRNIVINNYGLGKEEGVLKYNEKLQRFEGGTVELPIKTLEKYVDDNNIDTIDLLKIDAEGMDYEILSNSPKAVAKCKFIQYEYWDKPLIFHDLLQEDFDMEDIGCRNIFCMNKKLISLRVRRNIKKFIDNIPATDKL